MFCILLQVVAPLTIHAVVSVAHLDVFRMKFLFALDCTMCHGSEMTVAHIAWIGVDLFVEL